jgi:type VI secretion system secreted protein Hcp
MIKLNYNYMIIATVTLVLLLATSNHSMAAVDMFLKLTGIDGESTDKAHNKEIDLLAWSWGMTQTGNAIVGPGKPVIQDISFSKYVDASTPLLVTAGVTGSIIPSALLTIRKPGISPFEYLKITLTNVMVSSISSGGSDPASLTENVTFSFEAFNIDYTVQKADGNPGATTSSSYNIKNGK